MMKASTGLNVQGFNELLYTFTEIIREEQLQQSNRKRKPGGGRKGNIKDPEQKLFYILLYLKAYPTFDLAAVLFDSSKTRTYEWYQNILPLLEKALGRKCVLPKRQIKSMEEFIRTFPSVILASEIYLFFGFLIMLF
jgi:hypothetical protein